MSYIFLFLIWLTPAIIAGILGWSGIWGTGSAFIEYLIPLPVAGGVFHIPGLVVSFMALKILDSDDRYIKRLIGYGAFLLLIGMLTLHIDFPRFYSWLTTDYQPYGSPIRFDSNAVYLFFLTDAFWIWVYASLKGQRLGVVGLVIAITTPVAVLGLQTVGHAVGGPIFKIGGTKPGDNRGQESQFIFTTAEYDKEILLSWLDDHTYIGAPWSNPNSEHEAILFVNSMQLIKWNKYDDINEQNTIATVCSYEEDKSRTIHQGLYDCFSGKETLSMKIGAIGRDNPTGFHPWVNDWNARTVLCADVVIPSDRHRSDIALYNACVSLSRYFDKDMKKFLDAYGEDSAEIQFIHKRAEDAGLPKEIPRI